MAKYVLLDIEGTTTSISFVHDTLFPYAKKRLAPFLHERRSDPELLRQAAACQDTVEQEKGARPALNELPAILGEWIDQDRKHPALKAIQGMIWKDGYESGELSADLYEDVVPSLRAWLAKGLRLGIFSSGSAQAQRLLFGHTQEGDITGYFSNFFDTCVGGKREPASYTRISDTIGLPPGQVLFLSDIEAELDAAASAGLTTTQIVRPGTQAGNHHSVAKDFTQIIALNG